MGNPHVEFDDLWDPPFSNYELNAATDLFSAEALMTLWATHKDENDSCTN
ncbi:MAG: hypothetical protein U9R75_04225 [Candidatus Thermoplasmatota archaeon]|nr:hypothetical protein [Candidatus Thermoplasmatota archaeon]